MFGARVITLTLLGALFSLALDYAVRRFVFRRLRYFSDFCDSRYGTVMVPRSDLYTRRTRKKY